MSIEQITKKTEVRDYRCCMCPQIDMDKCICPAGPGKLEETICDFVITWADARGWKYKVVGDLAGTYKGCYQDDKHQDSIGWHGMRQMRRRESFDQAQEDLNRYAKSKGWHPIDMDHEIVTALQHINLFAKTMSEQEQLELSNLLDDMIVMYENNFDFLIGDIEEDADFLNCELKRLYGMIKMLENRVLK